MLGPAQRESIRPRLGIYKIIFAALMIGVVAFALIVILFKGVAFSNQIDMISVLLLGIGVFLTITAFVIPSVLGKATATQLHNQIKHLPRDQQEQRVLPMCLDAWFAKSLVGLSMLESAAFLNLVAMLMTGNAIHLVAAVVIVMLMVAFFPVEDRTVAWIEHQLSEVEKK